MIEFSCIRPTNILIIGWKPQRHKDQTAVHKNHRNCSVHFVAKLLRKTKCVPHFYIQCLQSHGLNACNCSNIGRLNCTSYDMHVFILFICFYLCCFCLLKVSSWILLQAHPIHQSARAWVLSPLKPRLYSSQPHWMSSVHSIIWLDERPLAYSIIPATSFSA